MKQLAIFSLLSLFLMTSCEDSPKAQAQDSPVEKKEVVEKTKPGQDTKKDDKVKVPKELSLKDLMIQLGKDMNGINDGIWQEDFPAIASSAAAISGHPHVGASTRARLKKTLGKDMMLFGKGDKKVHDTALRLGEAAKAKDMKLVLTELTNLQNGCVECHASFRSRLR